MKRIVLVVVLLTSMLTVKAQTVSSAEVKKTVAHITLVCGLSPSQAEDVKPVVEQYLKARKENKQRCGSDTKELNRLNKEAHENYLIYLGQILNTSQLDKIKPKRSYHKTTRTNTTHHVIHNGQLTHKSLSEESKKHKKENEDNKLRKKKKE